MKNDLAKFFNGKKVLITGHTGFKGSWLTKILVGWGANVVGLSLPPHTNPNLFDALRLKKEIKNYFADIRDFKKIQGIFTKEKPGIIFHLAAQALVRQSYENPLHTIFSNTLGTTNILEAVRKTDTVRSAVIITTDKVYENNEKNRPFKESDALGGHDPYSASKAAADIIASSYLKSFDLPVAVARAGNVIGGGDWSKDRLIPDVVRAFFERKKLLIRYPLAVRPWQHVLEPLNGYLILAKFLYDGNKNAIGQWNFGPNYKSETSVKDFLDIAKNVLSEIKYNVIQGDSKHESVTLKLDSSKSRNILDWNSKMTLSETITSTLFWYKQFYDNPKEIIKFTEAQIKSFYL